MKLLIEIAKSSYDLNQILLCKYVTIMLELRLNIPNDNMWNKCLFESILGLH